MMKGDNFFSGKKFKNDKLGSKEPVQYGPIIAPSPYDPVKDLLSRVSGKFPYEPNGLVYPDLSKSDYLKG